MPAAELCLVSNPTLGRAKGTIVPHWMLWLASYLERQGYGVDVIDVKSPVNVSGTPLEEQWLRSGTLERVAASQAPVVGLSGFSGDFRTLTDLAREIVWFRMVRRVANLLRRTGAGRERGGVALRL